MTLVTSATGNAGGAIVRALVNSGERVRAVVRDPDRASLSGGVEVAAGDLNEPQTLVPHSKGATAAFLLSGLPHPPGDVMRAPLQMSGSRPSIVTTSVRWPRWR